MNVISALQRYADVLDGKADIDSAQGDQVTSCGKVGGAQVSLYSAPSDIAEEWKSFEEHAGGCLFQSYRWVESWCREVSASAGEDIVIAVGRDDTGRTLFIWPLATTKMFGVKVLSWIAQGHSNYNVPNIDPDYAQSLDKEQLRAILEKIAQTVTGVCGVYLVSQPTDWAGKPNPFLKLPKLQSANSSYTVKLTPDFDELLKSRLGKNGQRNLRRKEKKLTSFGELSFNKVEGLYRRLDILEQFFVQKDAQFKDAGITNIFSSPTLRSFYRDLVSGADEQDTRFELFTLHINDELIATFNGMRHQNRFYLLLSSLTQSEFRRWSPGLIVMRHHIESLCERGFDAYDLGTGAGAHKSVWTNETVPLFDTFLPVNGRGRAFGVWLAAKTRAKRTIKNDPRLWEFVKSARKFVGKFL